MRWPRWLFDLIAKDAERQASARRKLDSLPLLSKAELRWICLALGMADRVDIILGAGGGTSSAEADAESAGADWSRSGGSDDRPEAAAAGGGVHELRSRADGSFLGAAGEGGPAEALGSDARAWLRALRCESAGWGLERHPAWGDRRTRLRSGSDVGDVASSQDMGEDRTFGGSHASAFRRLPRDEGHSAGVGLADNCSSVARCLFLSLAAGGAVRAEALRHLAGRDGRRSRVAGATGQDQKLEPKQQKSVRETRRQERLRRLQPLCEEYAAYSAFVAGFAGGLRRKIACGCECCDGDAKSLHRWFS